MFIKMFLTMLQGALATVLGLFGASAEHTRTASLEPTEVLGFAVCPADVPATEAQTCDVTLPARTPALAEAGA